MSISKKQLAANLANAHLCTGPKSVDDKKNFSQKARHHGVTAQTTVMTEEDRINHDQFCGRMVAELAPVGEIESYLASSGAEEACVSITPAPSEAPATAMKPDTPKFTPPSPQPQRSATAPRLSNCCRSALIEKAQRIHRSFQSQGSRHFSQLWKIRRLPYIPAPDGFVFSNAEIDYYTERFHRLSLAKRKDYVYIEHGKLLDLPRVA